MTTRFLPEIIYTIALTSLSTHMLWLRKESQEQRAYFTTRLKLLEDTAQRLRAGQPVPEDDFDLIRKMAREPGSDRGAARGIEPTDHLGWKEALLGRKGGAGSRSEQLDMQDWEEGR
ncbi:uncharacterized protein PHACADRAFT_260073 [Phanerochaete carnosa HHB-10118-sp]|uniref:Uncharacterized protein n=1 Tax=Phanerochaete carnosa (strain HHB-10118-sp) TaxID=650164 RepID=K5WT60_PHACS|nr:uncharacterized protein PHACADRAFT_260073 [Phanerochaete carnosa HHB-10118-sp]EKM53622.1 hypothetical protein PHACADRAFT_260073 [Phanerochaete carnosa HHB-10118-sp]